jgi:hypothetical protein
MWRENMRALWVQTQGHLPEGEEFNDWVNSLMELASSRARMGPGREETARAFLRRAWRSTGSGFPSFDAWLRDLLEKKSEETALEEELERSAQYQTWGGAAAETASQAGGSVRPKDRTRSPNPTP